MGVRGNHPEERKDHYTRPPVTNLSLLFIAVINANDQKQFGAGVDWFICLTLPGHSLTLRDILVGTPGRNWDRGHRETGMLPLTGFLSLLSYSTQNLMSRGGITCNGLGLPYQENTPIRLAYGPTGQSDGGNLSIKGLYLDGPAGLCQVDKN